MEPGGLEPPTFCMPCRRAPNCAMAPPRRLCGGTSNDATPFVEIRDYGSAFQQRWWIQRGPGPSGGRVMVGATPPAGSRRTPGNRTAQIGYSRTTLRAGLPACGTDGSWFAPTAGFTTGRHLRPAAVPAGWPPVSLAHRPTVRGRVNPTVRYQFHEIIRPHGR